MNVLVPFRLEASDLFSGGGRIIVDVLVVAAGKAE